MATDPLPIPPHFDPDAVDDAWPVPYQARAEDAGAWAREHGLAPVGSDEPRMCLVLVDVQNTFCLPEFELFVAGRSGTGAIDDNRRLCRFIYRNLHRITQMAPTLDTHQAIQIFHPIFLVDERGRHPAPFTQVSAGDVAAGRWRFNPELAPTLGVSPEYGQRHLVHYTRELEKSGKYALTVWPYHSMLGGIGHALVSSVEEAVFFHSVARRARVDYEVKARHPLTEQYSILGPEVVSDPDGEVIAERTTKFLAKVAGFDAVVIAGQAKSHCVAWSIDDLLVELRARDPALAGKVYLLEDCTSPVVVPGLDYTSQADAAFRRFAEAGMHLVRSTDPIESWPGL